MRVEFSPNVLADPQHYDRLDRIVHFFEEEMKSRIRSRFSNHFKRKR